MAGNGRRGAGVARRGVACVGCAAGAARPPRDRGLMLDSPPIPRHPEFLDADRWIRATAGRASAVSFLLSHHEADVRDPFRAGGCAGRPVPPRDRGLMLDSANPATPRILMPIVGITGRGSSRRGGARSQGGRSGRGGARRARLRAGARCGRRPSGLLTARRTPGARRPSRRGKRAPAGGALRRYANDRHQRRGVSLRGRNQASTADAPTTPTTPRGPRGPTRPAPPGPRRASPRSRTQEPVTRPAGPLATDRLHPRR